MRNQPFKKQAEHSQNQNTYKKCSLTTFTSPSLFLFDKIVPIEKKSVPWLDIPVPRSPARCQFLQIPSPKLRKKYSLPLILGPNLIQTMAGSLPFQGLRSM